MTSEMLICPRCGGTSPFDARFCIDCGEPLIAASVGPTTRLNTIACPVCHTPNPDNARFCVMCGRTFTTQPSPRLATPSAKPMPGLSPRATPSYTYPRVATPPHVSSAQPHQPAPVRHNTPFMQPGVWVFVIGALVLLGSHRPWPGILIMLGISMIVNLFVHGHMHQGMRTLLWLGGLALLFATGTFWPGIFILIGLSILFSKRGWW